jgi:septum formation protein
MRNLILASGSPRRKELLEKIRLPFEIRIADIDENQDGYSDAEEYAIAMSRLKAEKVLHETNDFDKRDMLLLSADTVVARRSHILGKPVSDEDAKRMLRLLSDGWHDVLTAMTLIHASTGRIITEVEYTRVHFRNLDETLIQRYVDSGEPADKAGAYGIQGMGSLLVERMEGCYFNVMGLPLYRLSKMLEQMGEEPLSWL